MYAAPRVKDFGRIELHTFVNGSPVPFDEPEEFTGASTGGDGGGGIGLGVIGLVGGAIALAGRGSNDQTVEAALPDEDEEQLDHR